MAAELQTDYGDFAADFAADCLSNLCEADDGIQTGPFGSQLHQEDYVAVGTPIITVEHLGENRIEHSDVPCVSDEDRERLSKYQLREGDIVFSRVGSVDRRAIVRKAEHGWLFSGRCLRVRPDKSKIHPEYLSYFFGLPSFKEYIRAIAVGATMPSLNTQILSDVVVAYPKDLNEQLTIAHILGTLDDKIELNRRMNRTLEAMARAIFKSWFIDFDPVHRNIARNGQNQPSPAASPHPLPLGEGEGVIGGISASPFGRGKGEGSVYEIDRLFPDRFEDSELGEIPAGWKVADVGTIAEVTSGKRPPVRFTVPSDDGLVLLWGGNGPMGFVPAPLFEKPILLTGRVGTLGSVFRIPSPCWPSDNTLVVLAKDETAYEFLYLQLERLDFSSLNRGSTQPLLTQSDLKTQKFVLPSEALLPYFHNLVSRFFARMDAANSQRHTLSALRDTLLPKLISGELRVEKHGRLAGAIK